MVIFRALPTAEVSTPLGIALVRQKPRTIHVPETTPWTAEMARKEKVPRPGG